MGEKLFNFAIILVVASLGWGRAALAGSSDPTTEATSTAGPNAATIPLTQPAPSAAETGAKGPDQIWNLHFQNTEVIQGYPAFSAKYSGPLSLPRGGQTRASVSADVMAGVRLWSGAEAHLDGLMWQGFGLHNTTGIDGFPNGEAYRIGTQDPNGTIARLFIRQTIGFGGEREAVSDDQLTLAGRQDISRLTLTLGRFAAADIFDTNAYANSARTQFLNWGFINNLGWDYPADTIGYDTGLALELNQPNWTLRFGLFEVPDVQNGMAAEDRFLTWPYDPSKEGPAKDGGFGMVMEFERRYSLADHAGAIRFLAYVNKSNMASYSQATSILEANGPGANISAAKAYRYKYGFGLNWEQEIATNVGIFSRLGWNDDKEQGWMFTDVGYTASLGLSIKGEAWHRPGDTLGLAGEINGISNQEKKFLQAGGTGILAGDGKLNYAPEDIVEAYYSCKITNGVFVTPDFQFVNNPAFNRDRGPVSIFAVRFHLEF